MRGQDIISIAITFIVGIFAGAYLYLTGAAAYVTDFVSPVKEKPVEFVIESEAYGSCGETCPSFRVDDDGSYHYLYVPPDATEPVVRKGKLLGYLNNKLHRVITKEELARQAKKTTPGICNYRNGEIDVRYRITLDGKEYVLDSCGTAVDENSPLWRTLSDVWDYLETGVDS